MRTAAGVLRIGLTAVALLVASGAHGGWNPRIVLVGDSIFVGRIQRGDGTTAHLLERELNAVVHNLSRGMATMVNPSKPGFDGFARWGGFVEWIARSDSNVVVVVLLGTNDWADSKSIDEFRAGYVSFLSDVGAIPLVCVTPLWRKSEGRRNDHGRTLEDFRQVIREVCADRILAEGLDLVPAEARYFRDGLHPNWVGHRELATGLMKILKPLLNLTPVPEAVVPKEEPDATG